MHSLTAWWSRDKLCYLILRTYWVQNLSIYVISNNMQTCVSKLMLVLQRTAGDLSMVTFSPLRKLPAPLQIKQEFKK